MNWRKMLRIKNGSDEVKIMFDHMWRGPGEINKLAGSCTGDYRRCTLVTIDINDEFVCQGVAVCHPGDNFCRATGRKQALKNAVSSLSKSLRSAIWSEYKDKCSF